jgi:regulator of protease activity HflC (stomatin/prohibitin superfamily)
MDAEGLKPHHEDLVTVMSGWVMLPLLLFLLLTDIGLLFYCVVISGRPHSEPSYFWTMFVAIIVGLPVIIILLTGLFALQPNESRVLILFGAYKGTVRQSGFHWANPFYANGPKLGVTLVVSGAATSEPPKRTGMAAMRRIPIRYKVSLRARTHNVSTLKVNDKRGNPIEIGAVIVWRVNDTARAIFDVDSYEKYVETQSETSLRHIASNYLYDDGEEGEVTLRGGMDEISQALRIELQQRLGKAGVMVDEARLTHLAYAPEIAQAMLRRQQAEAVIAARQKIVHGAVTMVEMALKDLAEKQVIVLDDERRAAMVSNLMVVLCGDSEVQPVVNAGTLYT